MIQQNKSNISFKKKTPVLLYIPNLIGYVRVICILIFFFLFDYYPTFSVIIYLFNVFLDYLDGITARRYGQCSKFGELFDVITDKVGTVSLVFQMFKNHSSLFISFLALNQVIETAVNWISTQNACQMNQNYRYVIHKQKILNLYLHNDYYLLDILVACEEIFHSFYLYMLKTNTKNNFVQYSMIIAFLGFLTKTYIGKIRLINGLRLARNIENKN